MPLLYHHPLSKPASGIIIASIFLLVTALLSDRAYAGPAYNKVIEVTLGDYRYMPKEITLIAEQPVILRLINVDAITPHNFTLNDDSDGLDVDVDIPAGETVDVNLMPLVTGRYMFYCNKQLLWINHRANGMEGTLTVVDKSQAEPPSR